MTDPLFATWEKTRQRRGDERAISDTRGATVRTFAEIEEEAVRLERDLFSTLPSGSVVAIQIGNDPAWPACLLACLRQRLVVLPLEREMAEQERETALRVCRASAWVTLGTNGAPCLTTRDAESIAWGEDRPVLLKLTSGTTAAPRAIRFQSAQLVADCEQICQTMGFNPDDLNFGVIPVSHSYGFSNLLTPLIVRGISLVLSRDRMPRAVLDDLARTRATIFAGMPVLYQAFVGMESVPDLPALRLCLSAGAPLPLAVAQKFRGKFGRSIHSFYGSSECGGICYDRAAALNEEGFVGEPMDGARVEVLETEVSSSRIRVHSAAAADGYFPDPDDDRLSRGCFAPDDLLARVDGGFKIVGRVSDLINVAGKKVNPAEVEATLLAFSGVREVVVFGRESARRNEEVIACIVTQTEVTETALLDFCRRRLSGWQVPKRIFFLKQMPVTARGKISRRSLAEQFAVSSGPNEKETLVERPVSE